MRPVLASAFLAAVTLAAVCAGRAAGGGEGAALRVIVLANSDDPDSVAVARHYALARGVPEANIIALPMPLSEEITWPQFVPAIWQPLQDELVRRGWIDAAMVRTADGSEEEDADGTGRRRYAVSGHRIAALVTCRGVPLRIADDPALRVALAAEPVRRELLTNGGAVDSELSLLAWDKGYPIDGCIRNPLFERETPGPRERARVVEVSRLDGPAPEDAEALVDRAIAAEREGLIGRSYVAMRGIPSDGDRWLAGVAAQVSAMGFDQDVSTGQGGFPVFSRCDAPALYFGWHQPRISGPFVLPGFRFPPGAIALHIHSYSADTLRSANSGWCGPLVAEGVAATLGNVSEPYLQLTHRPDLLVRALIRGGTLADAAYYALPALSWQAVVIGDPLYRPFSVSLRDQLKGIGTLPPRLAGYPVLRLMHLLDLEKRGAEALAAASQALAVRPGMLPVQVEAARRLQAAAKPGEAAAVLRGVEGRMSFATDEWALACEAARILVACGQAPRAEEVYRRLLGNWNVPGELRSRWLLEARGAAAAAGDAAQAAAWRRELDEMAP
jgi:uncharacterized protein (TIGR03790 family)